MADLSEEQRAFRDNLTRLLGQHARAVGPEFDGDGEEGVPMELPLPVGWVLVVDWDDAATSDNAATVTLDSGARWTHRLGMLTAAVRMVNEE